jgi:Flp pilus assembly pilin Flp
MGYALSMRIRFVSLAANEALKQFLQDDQGQDLIEYTLLLAFVALASAALFIGAGGSVSGIWSTTNSQLVVANTSAS